MKIYPSILSADFSILKEEIETLKGADGIHIDVMDGNFVPNLTFGAPVVKCIRKSTNLFFDVHLMIANPKKYIDDFVKAGADAITFHIEAVDSEKEVIDLIDIIKKYGIKAGVSVKPNTNLPNLSILEKIDLLLIMSVEPGFGGQKYIESSTEKINMLYKMREDNKLKFEIAVDGGINFENSVITKDNGADILIAGSTVFKETNRQEAIRRLKV